MSTPRCHRGPLRGTARLGALLLAAGVLLLGACTSAVSSTSTPGTTVAALPAAAQTIMGSPPYTYGSWSWNTVDLDTGQTLYASDQDKLNFLGSTAKLFTVGTYFDQLGADSTLETPVYATGTRVGGSLDGNLVVAGAGDFILGSRGVLQGDVQWTFPEHFYAYTTPLSQLVPADPLAGLDKLAGQVAAAGITSVKGDVLVDDRLWSPYQTKEGVVTPIMVNDNLIDMRATPGAAAGDPAAMTVRPQTAYFTVVNQVVTTPAGGEAKVTATLGPDNRIVVSGRLPVDAKPYSLATFAPDPAAYARALFIEALRRAGVAVDAPLATATGTLPADEKYAGVEKVASLTSPPASTLGKLILKTSDNRGAETLLCLLAVKAGSKTCDDGLATIMSTIDKAGVDSRSVFVYDGEGTDPASATPAALVQWLTWANRQTWSEPYHQALTDVNDDGTILVKGGTSAVPDIGSMPSLFVVEGDAGYMTTASGKKVAVALFASNASYPTVAEGLEKSAPAVKDVLKEMQRAG